MESQRRSRWSRFLDAYGIRSAAQVKRDLGEMAHGASNHQGLPIKPSTLGLFRPDLSLPAYAGKFPADRIAPIFNFFDRVGGGRAFDGIASRDTARDFRGGRLSYDQHDGTDFVCPRSTPLVAAAPGVAVAIRDTWYRGAITLCVDHGRGLITQYTHLSRVVARVGQPVRRGEVIARSGVGGIDMLAGAPWVPPHVHFMVWVNGTPVDPYLAEGERWHRGVWAHGNDPLTIDRDFPDDPAPPSLEDLDRSVNDKALDHAIEGCTSARIRHEILSNASHAARLAIVEDSVHHDRSSWAPWVSTMVASGELRHHDPLDDNSDTAIKLTLPLPHDRYRRAAPADAPWTRPT
jgi:murein DD-endopeptidase MepM/ murein hydrolase activator NlpD